MLKNIPILITEDTLSYQKYASDLTESWGMRPLLASDGAEAVAIAARHEIAICMMDIQMPRMNGFESASRIRMQTGYKFPIIAVTALGPSVREECLQCGMDDYLQKPYEDADLKALLTQWLMIYQKTQASGKKTIQ
ncbi:MAG: response regulator [Candidatus Omnitrophica bacterium]|nr:response regulator [Candidatus Omnitrophota bacterium]